MVAMRPQKRKRGRDERYQGDRGQRDDQTRNGRSGGGGILSGAMQYVRNGAHAAAEQVQRTIGDTGGVVLDTVDHRADSIASVLHGVIFGRIAPSSSQRRRIHAPVFVVGHPIDPIHPFVDADMLAAELPNVRLERATSILEWRFRPERLTAAAADFALECWQERPATTRARTRKR